MPPRIFSRYQFCVSFRDPVTGLLMLSDRDPFPFAPFPDNHQVTARNGDTLWNLANRYFKPLPDAALLWWIIADFQPDPIADPTIALQVGRVIHIPSVRTVETEIFSATRQQVGV